MCGRLENIVLWRFKPYFKKISSRAALNNIKLPVINWAEYQRDYSKEN